MDWQRYLDGWQRESRYLLSLVPPEQAQHPHLVAERRHEHFRAPGSAEGIAQAEARLGVRFPEAVQAFYLQSNGWSLLGMGDLALAAVEDVAPLPASPNPVTREVAEYFANDGHPDSVHLRRLDRLLLLSVPCRTGFCVANPHAPEHWVFAYAELGCPPQRFDDFRTFMESLRWMCHHYLRAYLD
jgi:hypothetical protein